MKPLALVAGFAIVSMACGPSERAAPEEPRRFEATGTVVGIEGDFVLIDHGEIPGFMDAMTMSFPVTDASLLTEIDAGARVRFRVVVDGSGYRIDRIEAANE